MNVSSSLCGPTDFIRILTFISRSFVVGDGEIIGMSALEVWDSVSCRISYIYDIRIVPTRGPVIYFVAGNGWTGIGIPGQTYGSCTLAITGIAGITASTIATATFPSTPSTPSAASED